MESIRFNKITIKRGGTCGTLSAQKKSKFKSEKHGHSNKKTGCD